MRSSSSQRPPRGRRPRRSPTSIPTCEKQRADPERQREPVTRVVRLRHLTDVQKQLMKAKEKQAGLLFGQKFNVPVHSGGEMVGHIRAQISTDEVVKRILGAPTQDTAEIPFAVDREATLYTRNATERERDLGVVVSRRAEN